MASTIKLITMSTAFLLLTWAVPADTQLGAAAGQQQQQEQQETQQAAQPQRIDLGDLMDNPSSYVGREVTIAGEVDDVLGPRMFTLEEGNWLDMFAEETLVFAQGTNAAILREDEDVEVTGTVRMFPEVQSNLSSEWGWPEAETELDEDVNSRPVVIAESIRSKDGHDLLGATSRPGEPAGDPADPTRRGTMGQPITETAEIAGARGDLFVGREVHLEQATIVTSADKGFWIDANGERLFVLPAQADQTVQQGDTVSIEGTVLTLPENMLEKIGDDRGEEDVYVYARTITKG